MEPQEDIDDVTEKVKEYADICKTIKVIQEKVKVLNKKKKELYKVVVPKLKSSNVTKCNLSFGTLKVVNSKKKVTPSKVTMKEKYSAFFGSSLFMDDCAGMSPEELAETMFKFIYVDNVEYKNEQSISMTYNKEFKEQFKDLTI